MLCHRSFHTFSLVALVPMPLLTSMMPLPFPAFLSIHVMLTSPLSPASLPGRGLFIWKRWNGKPSVFFHTLNNRSGFELCVVSMMIATRRKSNW